MITPAAARLASGGWSGRRGSNPRPTAWKAVTLPLSYSRLRGPHCRPAVACALFARCAAPRLSRQCRPALACRPTPLTTGPDPAGSKPTRPATCQDEASPRRHPAAGEQNLVARGGFEPPKPLGRQIYSLLHLTALQPRRSRFTPRPIQSGTEAAPGHLRVGSVVLKWFEISYVWRLTLRAPGG